MTPPVLRAADVAHPPERTFALFTDHIGAWWPLATHGLFGTQGTVGFEDGRRNFDRPRDLHFDRRRVANESLARRDESGSVHQES